MDFITFLLEWILTWTYSQYWSSSTRRSHFLLDKLDEICEMKCAGMPHISLQAERVKMMMKEALMFVHQGTWEGGRGGGRG